MKTSQICLVRKEINPRGLSSLNNVDGHPEPQPRVWSYSCCYSLLPSFLVHHQIRLQEPIHLYFKSLHMTTPTLMRFEFCLLGRLNGQHRPDHPGVEDISVPVVGPHDQLTVCDCCGDV